MTVRMTTNTKRLFKKSVSQNRQIASARSASRPDQRLHPAKRQKTAARPVCAPSPCSV